MKGYNLDKAKPIRVRLLLNHQQQGSVFETVALRLTKYLGRWNVNAELGSSAQPAADIHHLFCLDVAFRDYPDTLASRSTLFVADVKTSDHLQVLKDNAAKASLAICVSRATVEQLVKQGLPREKLCSITLGHEDGVVGRRIVLGITSQLRADGAKREDILLEVAASMRLDAFEFHIIGWGWERVISRLEAAGASVRYFKSTNKPIEDYNVNLERVPHFDYYLYFGFDEGSMGYIDALCAGLPTIVTPQGYHVDIENGITHSIINSRELHGVLTKLSEKRQKRLACASDLTWAEYARKHAIVWRALLEGRAGGCPLAAQ